MSEWSDDMKAAPKVGQLLLFVQFGGSLARTTGYWSPTLGRWAATFGNLQITPTHWMPLPSPPASTLQEQP